MTILLYTPYLDGISHLNKYLKKIALGLDKEGVKVILLVNFLSDEEKKSFPNIKIFCLDKAYREFDLLKNSNKFKWLLFRILFNVKLLFKLIKIYRHKKVEVIYFLSYEIVSLSFFSPILKLFNKNNAKIFIEIAASNFDTKIWKIRSFDSFWRFIMLISINFFNFILTPYYTFNSESHLSLFIEQLRFTKSNELERLFFIGDARKIKNISFDKELKSPISFLYFGTIREDKGFDVLCNSLALLIEKNLQFKIDIIGKSLGFDALKCLKENDLIERQFINIRDEFVSEEEIDLYFETANFLILPYNNLYKGSSGPLYESVSRGVPIIGTNVSEMGLLIDKHSLGFICRPNDYLDLYCKMEFVIEKLEKIEYSELITNVQKFAYNNSEELMIERLLKAFNNSLVK